MSWSRRMVNSITASYSSIKKLLNRTIKRDGTFLQILWLSILGLRDPNESKSMDCEVCHIRPLARFFVYSELRAWVTQNVWETTEQVLRFVCVVYTETQWGRLFMCMSLIKSLLFIFYFWWAKVEGRASGAAYLAKKGASAIKGFINWQ